MTAGPEVALFCFVVAGSEGGKGAAGVETGDMKDFSCRNWASYSLIKNTVKQNSQINLIQIILDGRVSKYP